MHFGRKKGVFWAHDALGFPDGQAENPRPTPVQRAPAAWVRWLSGRAFAAAGAVRKGGGWEVLSKPMQQEGFEKTYLVEFNLDRYATMKSDHHNNNRFVKELASLMGVNRKIIFLLPHLHTISLNVLLCLKDLDFAMRANYGELLICTSDYGSYSMLHNERLNVHSELDDALEALRFEKSMKASGGDKVYFPNLGVNYVGP